MAKTTLTPSSDEKDTLKSLDLVKEFNNLTDFKPRFTAMINHQDDQNPNKYILVSIVLEKDYLFITSKTGKYFYCLKLEKKEPLTRDELSLSEKILKFMYFCSPKSEYKTRLPQEELDRLKNMQKNILQRKKADVTILPNGVIQVSDYNEPSSEDIAELRKVLDENGL